MCNQNNIIIQLLLLRLLKFFPHTSSHQPRTMTIIIITITNTVIGSTRILRHRPRPQLLGRVIPYDNSYVSCILTVLLLLLSVCSRRGNRRCSRLALNRRRINILCFVFVIVKYTTGTRYRATCIK